MTDEKSAAILATPVFAYKTIGQVPLHLVQQGLIEAFEQWGMPVSINVDNGRPFGDPSADLPPILSLWLIGMGVDMTWSRPRCPTDNATVERMQAVTANWSEPARCHSKEQLQQQLNQAIDIQRSRYRVRRLKGQTRTERYPDLEHPRRPYEPETFSMEPIFDFLAEGVWVRKVAKLGQISFFGERWQVGARYKGKYVSIKLDRSTDEWIVYLEDEQHIIKRFFN